jgi:hypothetical protein
MVGVSLLFIVARLVLAQRYRLRFTLSDIFIIFAWVAFVARGILDILLDRLGFFSLGKMFKDGFSFNNINSDPSKNMLAMEVGTSESCMAYF